MENLSQIWSSPELFHSQHSHQSTQEQHVKQNGFQEVLRDAFLEINLRPTHNQIEDQSALFEEIARLKKQLLQQGQTILDLNQQLAVYDRQLRLKNKADNVTSLGFTESENPYAILGVHPESSAFEIKKAYHEKMKMFHPDRLQFMAKKINQAYESLQKNMDFRAS